MHVFYITIMSDFQSLPDVCQKSLAEHMRPDLFRALCEPIRISIVATLAARSGLSRVSDLTECCGIDFSGVSRHLKILRDAGIVSAEKRGREVFYTLRTEELSQTLHAVADALIGCKEISAKK